MGTSELWWMSAVELAAAIQTRRLSPVEITRAVLERIETVNPRLNAYCTVAAERALAEATAAEAAVLRGEGAGVLHGLPISFKDLTATAGIRTTMGSRIFEHQVPEEDAIVVERARRAGAVVVGKTNTPEFGCKGVTDNLIFGHTRNPWHLDRIAGGSSGGAAAAVAAGLGPLAEGSDLAGSIRIPAAVCGVVGFKASLGRVPLWPALNGWTSFSHTGPITRTVADTALLLSVLAGPDPRSPISLDDPGSTFAAPLDRDLTGLRVAWAPTLGGAVTVDPAVTAALAPAAAVFAHLGAHVEPACPDLTGADDVFRTLRAWLFAATMGPQRDRVKATLAANIDDGRRLTGDDLARAELARAALFHRVRAFFTRYDVLLAPVSQVPPFDAALEHPTEIDGVPHPHYLDWMASAYLISAAGLPALSVPAGFTPDGLPVGLQVVGPPRGDLAVLQVGHAFEQATQVGLRRP